MDIVPDDICHLPAKSPMKSHSRVVRMLSAHHPHVVRMSSARDFSSQTISSQRAETALLKMKTTSYVKK